MTQKSKVKQAIDNEDDIENNPNSTFFYDTTLKNGMSNNMEWREIYEFFQQGYFTDKYESDVDDLVDVKASQLHKIVVRPTIVPYYDRVWWIISHIDISEFIVVNSSSQVVDSFRLEDVNNMYRLSRPTTKLDDNFMNEFIKEKSQKGRNANASFD